MKQVVKFLFPIIIYFFAEWFFEPLIAMAIAACLSVVFMTIDSCKEKKFASSHLFDIVLIVSFGLIEHFCNNDSGLTMGLASSLFIAILLFPKFSFTQKMMQRLPLLGLDNPYKNYLIRRCQRRMIAWALFAALLYTIALLSDETKINQWVSNYTIWTVISGYIATELIVNRITNIKYRKTEWVPLMNDDGKMIGWAPRPLVHNGSLWLHPVVHLHVFNNDKLLLQLRPKSKKIQPGKWDTAVGGHIALNEKIETALQREAWEEIGLRAFEAKLIKQYVWKTPVEHEYVFSFTTYSKGPFNPKNVDEVEELKFWSKVEIQDNLGKGVFTPNLEHELREWILPLLK